MKKISFKIQATNNESEKNNRFSYKLNLTNNSCFLKKKEILPVAFIVDAVGFTVYVSIEEMSVAWDGVMGSKVESTKEEPPLSIGEEIIVACLIVWD